MNITVAKSKKFQMFATVEEAYKITENKHEINIKEIITRIEQELMKAFSHNIISGESENLLSNIKQDIIEAAIDEKYSCNIPEILHDENERKVVITILLTNGFNLKSDKDKITIRWDKLPEEDEIEYNLTGYNQIYQDLILRYKEANIEI